MRFSVGMPGLDRYARLLTGVGHGDTAGTSRRCGAAGARLWRDQYPRAHRDARQSRGEHGLALACALTTMAFVAGATSRIRVNSCVIVLPYHDRSCWRRR